MATVADYPDAVERIVQPRDDPDLSSDATSKADIKDELLDRDEFRVTEEVAENLAEAIVSEEDVRDILRNGDSIPEAETIASLADVADEYGFDDRAEQVAESVADDVLTNEDLEDILEANTTEEDIRQALEDSENEILGPDIDEIVEDNATVDDALDRIDDTTPTEEEIRDAVESLEDDSDRAEILVDDASGQTVTEQQFNAEVAQSVEQETPDDISTGVGVLNNENGEAVAVFGGTSSDRREQAADNLGGDIEDLGGNVNEALSGIEQVEQGNAVEARIVGETIATVSPE